MITTSIHEEIKVRGVNFVLPGELEIPGGSSSLVLFSHGSGSSRLSPRNQYVARYLRTNGIGTFLFDLLGEREDNVQSRFDISLLTDRLVFVTDWLMKQHYVKGLNIGYFGASTGAASVLNAAAKIGNSVKAVVSRGGRPDLAISMLSKVKAATMLLVGALDVEVLRLNREAFEIVTYPKELKVIPGAGHLFEEPGKLEQVADLASNWFVEYLG